MTSTTSTHRSTTDAERMSLASSHSRKRRRLNARRAALGVAALGAGAPRASSAAAPRQASARPSAIEVRRLGEVLLHDPDGNYRHGKVPQVLHIDADIKSATVIAALLMPEARVTHAASLSQARTLLASQLYSLVVLDPQLPDGDAAELLPLLAATPLLVYAARLPEWRATVGAFLPKPWTTPRQLWSTISSMLGIANCAAAGD